MIEEGFVRMRASSSREDASAQLHRLLTLSRFVLLFEAVSELPLSHCSITLMQIYKYKCA